MVGLALEVARALRTVQPDDPRTLRFLRWGLCANCDNVYKVPCGENAIMTPLGRERVHQKIARTGAELKELAVQKRELKIRAKEVGKVRAADRKLKKDPAYWEQLEKRREQRAAVRAQRAAEAAAAEAALDAQRKAAEEAAHKKGGMFSGMHMPGFGHKKKDKSSDDESSGTESPPKSADKHKKGMFSGMHMPGHKKKNKSSDDEGSGAESADGTPSASPDKPGTPSGKEHKTHSMFHGMHNLMGHHTEEEGEHEEGKAGAEASGSGNGTPSASPDKPGTPSGKGHKHSMFHGMHNLMGHKKKDKSSDDGSSGTESPPTGTESPPKSAGKEKHKHGMFHGMHVPGFGKKGHADEDEDAATAATAAAAGVATAEAAAANATGAVTAAAVAATASPEDEDSELEEALPTRPYEGILRCSDQTRLLKQGRYDQEKKLLPVQAWCPFCLWRPPY